MVFKMELFIVMFAFVACFAQDISFQENTNPEEEGSDNRVGDGRPPWLARPGGNGFRPNGGFQPGQFRPNNNQGFNPNGGFSQNSNQGFNPDGGFSQNSNSNGRFPQNSNSNGRFPQNSNSNGRFPQNSNSNGGFSQNSNPNGRFPQNSNSNGGSSQNSNQGFNPGQGFDPQNPDPGFAPSARPPAQTSQGSLRPPPVSSQKIISLVPCTCPFTPEYSPVCGSDSQTYLNAAVLSCYRTCGFDVTIARGAACAQTAGRTRISK